MPRLLERTGPIDGAVVGEPTNLDVAIAQRGIMMVDLVALPPEEAIEFFRQKGFAVGFDYRDVGPRVNNRPVGGDILATGSLEYSIPLYRDTLGGSQHVDVIRMVFFYDWGTLLPDWDSYQTQSWRMSWGFGFRLNPLGFPVPFALDFGWVLKREPEDDTELISVTFDVRF